LYVSSVFEDLSKLSFNSLSKHRGAVYVKRRNFSLDTSFLETVFTTLVTPFRLMSRKLSIKESCVMLGKPGTSEQLESKPED